MLGGGGYVAADGVPVAGGLLERSRRSLLLGLGGPQVAFGLVVRRRDRGVGEEPEHVGFAVEAFQQAAGGRLFLVAAGDAADLGQADGDAVAEQASGARRSLGGDGGQALAAGDVGGVDEAAQGLGDLGRARCASG